MNDSENMKEISDDGKQDVNSGTGSDSKERYRRAVVDAAAAVRGLDLPEHLETVAFHELLRDALGASESHVQSGSQGKMISGKDQSRGVLERIAGRLKVPLEAVESIYLVEEGDVRIEIPIARLSKKKRPGTIEILLAVCAGRQAGLGESEVDVDRVRDACQFHARYDQANFMKTIQGVDEWVGARGRRNSSRKTCSLRKAGWEEAARTVARLGGSE